MSCVNENEKVKNGIFYCVTESDGQVGEMMTNEISLAVANGRDDNKLTDCRNVTVKFKTNNRIPSQFHMRWRMCGVIKFICDD